MSQNRNDVLLSLPSVGDQTEDARVQALAGRLAVLVVLPGCLRRQVLWWEIDQWMLETPGRWQLKMSSDGGRTWQGELFFTLIE